MSGKVAKIPRWGWTLLAAGLILLPLLFWWIWWVINPSTPEQRSEVVKAFAQIAGGLAVVVGVYFTWKNFEVNQSNQRTNEKNQLENQHANRKREGQTQEAQFTDRYTKAIGLLGGEHPEVCLGSIYALERLAKDSPSDYWTIMEVLTAYVRINAAWNEPQSSERQPKLGVFSGLPQWEPRHEIQAIVSILCRRRHCLGDGETMSLDLRGTDLRGANFSEAHLEGANFSNAHLEGASFNKTHLRKASFLNSHLKGAQFSGALIKDSEFYGSHDAELEQANPSLG